jgi:hypothetical protein
MSEHPKMNKSELEEFYAKRKRKNWAFLIILTSLITLFFAITILKMS